MLKEIGKYGVTIRGVIHVGAHEGQEYKEYEEAGIRNMLLFEPVQSNFKLLMNTVTGSDCMVRCFNMALGNRTGTMKMFIETANRGMSCSLLKPKEHLLQYPWITFDTKEVVLIDKLDNIAFDRNVFNFLNVDVQGFELDVFKGARQTMKYIDAIYTEVNNKELYKGCARLNEIDRFMLQNNFTRVTAYPLASWGEAMYIKNKFLFDT